MHACTHYGSETFFPHVPLAVDQGPIRASLSPLGAQLKLQATIQSLPELIQVVVLLICSVLYTKISYMNNTAAYIRTCVAIVGA